MSWPVGIAIGLIVLVVAACAYQLDQYDRFNTWADDCNDKGGIISEVRKGFVSTRYECFKDGKIIYGIKEEEQ